MKISVDTKEDSAEEIERVVELLSALVHKSNLQPPQPFSPAAEQPAPADQPAGIFNLFGDGAASAPETPNPGETSGYALEPEDDAGQASGAAEPDEPRIEIVKY
ncbi:MAG: hypothetical protein ABH879_02410 [archaeon]